MGFKKGQSGNPGGRPKKSDAEREVELLARAHGPAAIKRLKEWMASDNAKASVGACVAMLNRGYGTPKQTVDTTVRTERYVVEAPPPAKEAEEWAGKHGPH